MATAQEILNAMEEVEEQNVIVIDSDLRTIRIPDGIKILGVESDDDVLRLHFKMPKMYGEFDLSTFALRVNYLNANGDGDVFEVQDAAANGDELKFSWLVGRTAAQYKGDVKFIVCAKKVKEGGIVEKEFNTTPATLPVLEGLETIERVAQENPDVIEAILLRLDKLEKNGGGAEPDATLTQSGKAADAKATGDALNELKEANAKQDEAINALKENSGRNTGEYPATFAKDYRHNGLSANQKQITVYEDERYTSAPHIFLSENLYPDSRYIYPKYFSNGCVCDSDGNNIFVKGTPLASEDSFVVTRDGADYSETYRAIPEGIVPGDSVDLYVFANVYSGDRTPTVRVVFYNEQKSQLGLAMVVVKADSNIGTNKKVTVPEGTAYVRYVIAFNPSYSYDCVFCPVLVKTGTEIITGFSFKDGTASQTTENTTDSICTAPHPSVINNVIGTKKYIDKKVLDVSMDDIDPIDKRSFVTPEMFGAWGDGLHDDTKHLQKAIDYAIENGRALIGGGTYQVSEPIVIRAERSVFDIQELYYDGEDCAVIVAGSYNRVTFGRIRALSGIAFRLDASVSGTECDYNNISIARAAAGKNAVEYVAKGYSIVGNRLTFDFLSCGRGYACIWQSPFEDEVEGAIDVGNNNFYGGRLEGGAWGVYNARHQDTYMTCMFENIDNCIHQGGGGMVRIIAPRYVEIISNKPSDGKGVVYAVGVPYDVVPENSIRHSPYTHMVLAAPSAELFTTSIDVSGVPLRVIRNGAEKPIDKNVPGAIEVPTRLRNSNGALVANSFMIFGNHLLIKEPATRKTIHVTSSASGYAGDYHTTGNDDEFLIYDTFVIDENGCDYTLPPSYDAIAFNEFVVVQQEGTDCTFRDWRGTVVFDGAEYGAGTYKVLVGTSSTFVGDYENNGQIWEIRRMSDYSLVDTMPHETA